MSALSLMYGSAHVERGGNELGAKWAHIWVGEVGGEGLATYRSA